MDKLIYVLASFSEDQRKDIYNYFLSFYGKKFADEMTTNYSVKGKAKNISTSDEISPVSANLSWFTEGTVKTSSKKDLDVVENYWSSLLGKDLSKKSVKDYSSKGEKPKTTSGQTKVSSKKKAGKKPVKGK
jgi:hypothetical protein